MKKLVFAVIAVIGAVVASAEETPAQKHRPSRLEMLSRKGYKVNGGALVKPESQRGALAIIDQQGRVGKGAFDTVKATIEKNQKIVVKVATEDKSVKPVDGMRKAGADFAISVVDDADTPVMLVAPEERWAAVNVAKLAPGVDGKEAKGEFLASRLRKELLRAFAFLCGGAGSQFDGNIMSASSVAQLDEYQEFVPMDMVKRAEKYMEKCGVTPLRIATYRQACREGWAPAPTNDVQKAIWDKVHAIPKTPMKIEFDPKKGR